MYVLFAFMICNMFIYAGYDANCEYINDLYELKLPRVEWVEIECQCFENGIEPRSDMSFFELENQLHLFGGYNE